MKLSKRELILLIFLLIIGLTFLEYRFILKPGLAKLADLTSQEITLKNELDTINFNLTMATAKKKTLDENLAKIDSLAQPYLSDVSPDTLLLFTHQVLARHGFIVNRYTPLPISASNAFPETAAANALTYRIKEIAKEYQAAATGTPVVTEPAPDPENEAAAQAAEINVEKYSLQVEAYGTYDQIKAMLNDFASLNRKILISQINMTPDPTIPDILAIKFMIEYYGIEKLEPAEDPLSKWERGTLPASALDPYANRG